MRLDIAPGLQGQVDFGYVGLMIDLKSGKKLATTYPISSAACLRPLACQTVLDHGSLGAQGWLRDGELDEAIALVQNLSDNWF